MSGSLTHSPAQIISQLLIDLALGTAPADNGTYPVYTAIEPDSPDNVITVTDQVGRISGRQQVTGQVSEHHGAQIRVRNQEHKAGFTKARAVLIELDETVVLNTVSIDSSTYTVYAISRTTDVLAIGKETPTSKRDIFTINVVVALRQTV